MPAAFRITIQSFPRALRLDIPAPPNTKMERTARPWGLGHEPLNKVGATSQPLGFPAPLASRNLRDASGTGRAHRLTIRSTSEIRHWFKWLSLPPLLRRTAPFPFFLSAKTAPTPR